MEAFVALFAMVAGLAVLAAPVLAFVALARASRLARDLDEMRPRLAALESRLRSLGGQASRAAEPTAEMPQTAPSVAAAQAVQTTGTPAPPPVSAPPAAVARSMAASAAASGPQPSSAASRVPSGIALPRSPTARRTAPNDFATNLGPKLLVAAGGLAVVVFLGFFVRYAWENDWVGPTGRVLSAAVFSLGLLAGGLRLLDREYRPLGQGLAASGLAGLYVTAFATHAVYALVPRSAAAALMVVVTGCAVALADRLDARLLAVLAWVGGYLAPVLLSTGEDRAVSLFAYLLLLGAGAVWLDHRKPWAETLPLALAGTAVLYGGWYAQHFRPERFLLAAVGLVLLSALLALGAATKRRTGSMALVALAATAGLVALGAGADRPEILLPLSLGLAAALLRAPGAARSGLGLLALSAVGLPFVFWAAVHYRPDALGTAAAWVLGGTLLLALVPSSGSEQAPVATQPLEPQSLVPALALVGGGITSVVLASGSDRPFALMALLAAQAGLAVLVARRWDWAETAGAAFGGGAVLAWYERFFARERADQALALALVIAGLYFLITTVRGLLARQPLVLPGALTHLIAAGLAWTVTYRVLSQTAPSLLGPACVALGAVHLAVGLVARRRADDPLRVRVGLGLAAGFLTIAVPVQLGLHGITLGWAVEGILLLWLGAQHRSWRGRAFGYGVLALAVGRLFVRHLPLHPGAFVPVWNPAFGAWAAVIASLAVAWWMVRGLADGGDPLDRRAAGALGPGALALLFGLLTMETQAAFAQTARAAAMADDAAGARSATLQGDLAVSVLWTLFATGLLAGGLAARSRGLFYAAYALFAVTAGKVVLVDLATLPTLYRMLSFLALGVLLLAGAWLNLRFRERLAEPGQASS